MASIRIFVRITWPTGAVSRLWDGAGAFLTTNGELWKGVTLVDGIEAIELALNGEAFTLNLSLVAVSNDEADVAWLSYTNDEIIGGVVELLIQPCDDNDQPVGDAEIRFTGTVDNILFDDRTESGDGAEQQKSTITIEVTNRFTLRRLTSGSVLSDVDQRARAAVLNPGGDPDRFCERVPGLADKTITWPRWN